MSDPIATGNLGLPFIAAAQAQKHVTHNEALRRLDAVVQLAVLVTSLADPPGAPAEGDRYIVADGGTGDWEDADGKVAAFLDGAWAIFDPLPGWIAYDMAAESVLVRQADGWTPVGSFLGTITRLGINATADDTNRLAVRSAAVLFSGIEAGAGGSGDIRFTVNKETDGDTATLLFQSGWSGRAEVGLAGDTDFVFKVSADGSTWTEAIRIDKDTGFAAILYDNGASGLTATNVQDAIDEVAAAASPPVASVFGRTGAVAAALHDYDASQVDNDSGVSGATVKDALDSLASDVSSRQAGDADLTALAGLSTTGLVARTGAGTAAARTLTGPAAGVSVSNGDGVAGNPTLALANDLAALEGLTGTGIAKRTGTDAWATGAGVGDLAATTANRLFGSDGSGNPGLVTLPAAGIALSAGALALANDLAAYEGLSATGLVARTADGAAAVRTLTGPAAGISVSNGDGVSGNPTLALANDLAALEGLSGTGIAKRTGADAWATGAGVGDLAATTANRLFGSDGSGNPGLVTLPAAGIALSAGALALANDLSALEGLSGTGIAKRTGADAWATGAGVGDLAATTANRLFGSDGTGNAGLVTLPAAGIALSAGALALANDLSALEGLASTGIAVRSATDTWVQRSIAAATGLSVSNGSGVSGNPSIALDISALVEDTAPDPTADFWLTYDASASAHKKVKPASLYRERLTADRTYYVRTDGSDSNTGLANSAGGAFLTVQKAYDTIAANLDLGGKTVTIQIGDGTYAPASGTNPLLISQPWTGGGSVIVQGNNATPANVVLSGTNADAVLVSAPLPGVLSIRDLKVTTTTNKSGIQLNAPGSLTFSNLNFGACVVAHLLAACTGAQITGTGNYAISGNAPIHAYALTGSIVLTGLTVTLTGTPAFSTAFVESSRTGVLRGQAMTFSGSATGPRYLADANGVIFTNGGGATYFPGNSAGSTATGGQYI
ncbi:MAG TPA: DUF2793 domain-containing protein [Bauldia sp.]|nr:DUF2793 domain-containing protein [Bauldia sp.]